MTFEFLFERMLVMQNLFIDDFLYLVDAAFNLVIFILDIDIEKSTRHLQRFCLELSLEKFNVHWSWSYYYLEIWSLWEEVSNETDYHVDAYRSFMGLVDHQARVLIQKRIFSYLVQN